MDKDLQDKIKFLRLSGLIDRWDEIIADAEKRKIPYSRFLRQIIEGVYADRQEQARLSRVKRANIPEKFVIETFPFDEQPKMPKAKTLSVYDSFKYMTAKETIIWIGPTGAGKSGLATSFLMQALNRGHSGRFVKFSDLIDDINESIADNSSKAVLHKYASYDCLLIDEIGYVETETTQIGLFFRLMQSRHKHKTTLITTNLGFSEWGTFLKNEHLTAALIDRLTENCHVFNLKGCKSLRSKKND